MPGWWAEWTSKPETLGLGLLVLVALLGAALGIRLLVHRRPTAAELERRRREAVNSLGKIGDGEIVELEGSSVVYSYHVGGVGYFASQDLSALESVLPSD